MRRTALVWLALASVAAAEERPWVEVKSARFTVLSQAGEGPARDLAWQFEQVHSVFSKAYPWAKLESGRPFVVLAVRNEAALRELSPAFWQRWNMRPGAAYVSDAGADFVAIRTDLRESDDLGENPYSTAYEGYVSIVLNASFPGRLPFWFERGLRSFFGNTLVRQKDVHVGRLIKRYLEQLNQGSRYSLPELMAIDADSPSLRKEADRYVFEAQAWLLVHYLFFGAEGANQAKLNRYADLLRAGRPAPDAFREAIGDPAEVEKGLSFYLSRRLYRYTQLNLDVNVDRAAFRARPVSPAEATAMRAQFLSAMREPPAAARALAESALKLDAKQPAAHEALGLIADDESREEDARAAFAAAAENGSTSFFAHYRLAQLLWKPDNDKATLERIARALERSAQLNPDHPWSHAYLADTRVDLDDAAAGLDPARKAVSLAPGQTAHRRTLARVLGKLGQLDAAQQEGGRALALARDDQQRQQARETLVWLTRQREYLEAKARGEAVPEAAQAHEGGTVPVEQHPCDLGPQACEQWLPQAEQACADGSLEACSSAGWAWTAAPGMKHSPAKAAPLLEKACTGGRQDACVNLAVILVNRQTPESLDRALDLLGQACAARADQACELHASLKAARRR